DCGEMAVELDDVVHNLKFGAEAAARVMRRVFPEARDPTQQLHVTAPTTPAETTPSKQKTPTPVGERMAAATSNNVPTEISVAPSAPTRLKKAVARLTEPTLRAWKQRERRRIMLVAAVATFAVAGALVTRVPAPSQPTVTSAPLP